MTRSRKGAELLTAYESGGLGQFKNRIINGAMMIDQRNARASVTPTSGTYTLDRWRCGLSQTSKITVQQSSSAPTGFVNSLLVTSSSAYSIGAGDYFNVTQPIEGLNIADLGWGAAGAAAVTLSFWVKSSLTGSFGGSIQNSDGTRSYPFAYTINVANTWEQKSITISGDTTGIWLNTNGVGLYVVINLGTGATYSGTAASWQSGNYVAPTGATSVVGTNGATFYITGVQLEKGSTATSFDYRPYGTELALCQRYCWTLPANSYYLETFQAYWTTNAQGYIRCPVPMRASPSLTNPSSLSGATIYAATGSAIPITSLGIVGSTNGNAVFLEAAVSSGLVAGNAAMLYSTPSSGVTIFASEL